MSTHLDDQGQTSRMESAKLILETIADVTALNSNTSDVLPVFLGGDFNSEPNDTAYQILNSKDSTIQDVKDVAEWKHGHIDTFTGFLESTRKKVIDFVFIGLKGMHAWNARGYSVLENRFEDGIYISDHRAVVGDLILSI
jgi:endonuclease/exonuclease/phosphatase family metal-dependent hydrolase